jgi:hypothetical protein
VARWRVRDCDGKELFYLSPDDRLLAAPIRLDSHNGSAEVGRPVPLFAARLGRNTQRDGSRQYMVSADGQRFLMDTPAVVTTPITIVLNWTPGP